MRGIKVLGRRLKLCSVDDVRISILKGATLYLLTVLLSHCSLKYLLILVSTAMMSSYSLQYKLLKRWTFWEMNLPAHQVHFCSFSPEKGGELFLSISRKPHWMFVVWVLLLLITRRVLPFKKPRVWWGSENKSPESIWTLNHFHWVRYQGDRASAGLRIHLDSLRSF